MLHAELIRKYNVPGPRYTSYPTALNLKPIERKKRSELTDLLPMGTKSLSLYMHIPFCHSLCWYCGCSRIITQNPRKASRYLDTLEKEMQLASKELSPKIKLEQVHFGGGTPTFLSPEQVHRLGEMLNKYFNLDKNVEFGVEIDPRSFTEQMADAWVSIGMNRASLGVQDTDESVQKAINRIQPLQLTAQSIQWLRDRKIKSINLDLIYGLPKQTLQSFEQSLYDTLALQPDRYAIYSYAHLPNRFAGQRLIDESTLPQPEDKLSMLLLAHQIMENADYTFIGMDHFAKRDDDLSRALENGTLQRNFMGYSTKGGLDMLGLGLTSISKLGNNYLQNAKELRSYEDLLHDKQLPYEKAFSLTQDDQIRQQIIMDIMCKRSVDFDEISTKFDIDSIEYLSEEIASLEPLQQDGLLEIKGSRLRVSKEGSYLLRNIAMQFDAYLSTDLKERSFSKTI